MTTFAQIEIACATALDGGCRGLYGSSKRQLGQEASYNEWQLLRTLQINRTHVDFLLGKGAGPSFQHCSPWVESLWKETNNQYKEDCKHDVDLVGDPELICKRNETPNYH